MRRGVVNCAVFFAMLCCAVFWDVVQAKHSRTDGPLPDVMAVQVEANIRTVLVVAQLHTHTHTITHVCLHLWQGSTEGGGVGGGPRRRMLAPQG